jgi:cellulose synthase/poly-beta-1,6-N-acetylglucosamine synthase-like glycosyltransferase
MPPPSQHAPAVPDRQTAPDASPPLARKAEQGLIVTLLRDGAVAPHRMLRALAQRAEGEDALVDLLLAGGHIGEAPLYDAMHRLTGVGPVDLAKPADPRLIDQLGAGFCLMEGLLPWQRCGDAVVVATATSAGFQRHAARLAETFGTTIPALAAPAQIERALRRARGPHLARAAETRVATSESCRGYRRAGPMQLWGMGGLALCALAAPRAVLAFLSVWAIATMILTMGMKLAALAATCRRPAAEPANPAVIARLPVVSVMVALYRESDIAARLVRRLGRLDYPRALLDIVLVVEEGDHITRLALIAADLPPWMRVVVAPAGRVMTKPRALNFGLTQCRGSIVGVYDAEDAPEPDQIRRVVDRFHQRGPQVACLQGALDFYNPHRNWLARCFTIEYAGWFRVVLPGLQRLGLPLPLGGTTLFFRREVLERLGGWDAHNVTEDADLGMRLARHGYRTEVIETTTHEEANCLVLPWVKQRSRWIKGYMMTWITHMRRPVALWRELGPRGFLGFQALFLGSLSQALLLPLLWSFWLLALGLGHPLQSMIGPGLVTTVTLLFLGCEALNIAIGVTGLRRSGQRLSLLWVPTLTLYFPLQALAAYKALWEMLRRPFYWDKTSHGALSKGQG